MNRFLTEYGREKKRPLILALDFDGTVCEWAYPKIGKPNKKVIDFLKDWKRQDNKIILWTCRSGQYAIDAINWLYRYGIEIDSLNDDLDYIKKTDFGREKSCKVCADFYLDDKSLKIEDLD